MKQYLPKSLLLLAVVLMANSTTSIGQNVNITVLKAQYDHNGKFHGFPLEGKFTLVWKKDQRNIALETGTVLLKVIFTPEVALNQLKTFTLPDGWQVLGIPASNSITLVNAAPFATEDPLTVDIPVRSIAARSATQPWAGAYISNNGGDWNNLSTGWEVSTSVTVADNPLPVTLVSIHAKTIENAIKITWQTVQEIDFDHFELQTSLHPSKGFTMLANIESLNQSQGGHYSFLDKDAPSGVPVFYRLKMIDQDKTFAMSKIVTARIGTDFTANVFPNPASSIVTLKADQPITQVQMVAMSGQTVIKRKFSGQRFEEVLPLPQLIAGSYILIIITEEGKVFSETLIVK